LKILNNMPVKAKKAAAALKQKKDVKAAEVEDKDAKEDDSKQVEEEEVEEKEKEKEDEKEDAKMEEKDEGDEKMEVDKESKDKSEEEEEEAKTSEASPKQQILDTTQSSVYVRKNSISQLKSIVYDFLSKAKEGETQAKEIDFGENPIFLEIYETFPLFLAHDGYFFISLAFEQECWTSLRQYLKPEKMKLSDMPHYRLETKKIKLLLRKVHSS